jgi:hypothetical protein
MYGTPIPLRVPSRRWRRPRIFDGRCERARSLRRASRSQAHGTSVHAVLACATTCPACRIIVSDKADVVLAATCAKSRATSAHGKAGATHAGLGCRALLACVSAGSAETRVRPLAAYAPNAAAIAVLWAARDDTHRKRRVIGVVARVAGTAVDAPPTHSAARPASAMGVIGSTRPAQPVAAAAVASAGAAGGIRCDRRCGRTAPSGRADTIAHDAWSSGDCTAAISDGIPGLALHRRNIATARRATQIRLDEVA